MPISHIGPLNIQFPRIAEVQTKATEMMELLQLSYNTSVLGIRGFTREKAELGVGGTLRSLIQAGYRLLYSIRPVHSGKWTTGNNSGADTALWVKELKNELCPEERWKPLREVEQAWGDSKVFTIQSVDLADSIAPTA